MPFRCALVEKRPEARLRPLKLAAQHVSEQGVVPVPRPARVQGDDEQVGAFELLKDALRPARTGDGVTEPGAHPVKDRGPGQERADVRRLRLKDLGDQIVGYLAVVTRERLDLPVKVLVTAQGQSGEVQTRGPSLGALL